MPGTPRGGLPEYLARGFGPGHVTGASCWLTYASNIVVTALVASSFGSYASSMFIGEDAAPGWDKVFAAAILLLMLWLNVVGTEAVAKGAVGDRVDRRRHPSRVRGGHDREHGRLAARPVGYPSWRQIVSSVALTFFAFLGFGVVTFTAKNLPNPSRQLPRAMYLALSIATVTYVAVALGGFGTLTVDEVIESGGTAIAVAAEPTVGQVGFWLMSVTGLFATAGATNSGIYPAGGLSLELASTGQFPPLFGRSIGRAPVGMLIMVAVTLVLVLGFDLAGKFPATSATMAGMINAAPMPSRIDQPNSSTARFGARAVVSEPKQ